MSSPDNRNGNTADRASGEEQRARELAESAARAGDSDDARILRGRAAVARLRAETERRSLEMYRALKRGEEVA